MHEDRDLLARARRGDGDAFSVLIEPHRRELHVHCYRMLGSFQDAEDALQDTLLTAWQGLGTFEGRATLRTWLYRIATNRCLNVRRSVARRPARAWPADGQLPEPTRLDEVTWLEPYPDDLLDGASAPLGPEARYARTEAISLAFVTALQLLPARQRAVVILRDVLGYHADEVADLLDSSVASVSSALKRGRARLRREVPPTSGPPASPAPASSAEQALAARFVRAYESGDIDGLVAMLTEDVRVAMPPVPYVYEGRELVRRFFACVLHPGGTYHLLATRANGQLAFGAYRRAADDGVPEAAGLLVLTTRGDRVGALTRFDEHVLGPFGLPAVMPTCDDPA